MSDGTSTGLSRNVAGLLCYLLWWFSGLTMSFIETDRFVRFHAMQSIFTFGGISLIMAFIYLMRSLLWAFFFRTGGIILVHNLLGILNNLILIAALVLWVILMVKAYQDETYRLPYVGQIAEKQLQ